MKKGFTLLELITVIIIIGILFALALPSYMNYVNNSRKSQAQSVVGVIYNAQKIYKEKNGVFLKSEDVENKYELFKLLGIAPTNQFLENWDVRINYHSSEGEYIFIICRSIKWKKLDFLYNSKEGIFQDI